MYHDSEHTKFDLQNAVCIEAKQGDVIVFDGSFVHFSEANKSSKPRHAITMHVVEGRNTIWEPDNWLI